MNYYQISMTSDLNIIGHYPQTKLRTDQGDNVRVDGYLAMKAYKFPDFIPNYKLELHPKAKPTNFLSKGPVNFGWIVDGKLKRILESYKLPKHHYYKIKVFYKTEVLDYFWLHYIVDDFWDFLNTENSYCEVFSKKTPFEVQIDKVFPILSKEQVIEEKKKYRLGRTRIGKITMKSNFPKYDLYETDIYSHTIISHLMKSHLEKENITGIEIKPFDKFIIDE